MVNHSYRAESFSKATRIMRITIYYVVSNDIEEEGGDEHEYHVLEGPGGDTRVHQNRELEMREVKESGEEHMYHILEGLGSDDASKEAGMREVGGAMDYEIPLPLKNGQDF